jgi:small-conductance mechanosensitive channel
MRAMLLLRLIACLVALGAVTVLPSGARSAATADASPAVERPAHGGGGFALVLVRSRIALEHLSGQLRAGGAELLEGTHRLPGELMAAWQRVSEGANPVALIAGLLAILGVALLARHAVRRRLVGSASCSLSERADGFGRRLGRALYGALVDLLGLAVFALVILALIAAFVPAAGAARTFVFTYVTAALVTLAVALVARFLLAPDAPDARLLPLADPAARFLLRWSVGLAAAGSVGWLSAALLILSGMPLRAHLLLALMVGAVMAALLVAMILQGRSLVAAAVLGDDPAAASPLRRRLAGAWHLFAIGYLVAIWLLWAASIVTRGPSSIWAAVASVVLAAVVPLVDKAFGHGLAEALGGAAAGARLRTIAVARQVFRIVLGVIALILLLWFWGIDVLRLVGAPGAGVLSHALFNIVVTTLLAYVVWQLAETALERSLGGGAAAPATLQNARARTLRPLLRKFMLGALIVIWMMIALSAVGIDIGPLLAGAGVVGIALGFGAQTLVRDVVSGIFFLLDDAFRVGEYVEAGSLKGTVEAISIRSLRLRHHRGAVHTVPYGELKSLTNHSRDWVIVKLEFLVTYDTDVDQVKRLLKGVGQELLEDPDLGPNLIETLKSQGINQLADHGLLVRAKFTATPGEQFVIKREALQRIKRAFDAAGIKFAYPTVTIHSTGDGPPSDDAVRAAARMAIRAPAPAEGEPVPA